MQFLNSFLLALTVTIQFSRSACAGPGPGSLIVDHTCANIHCVPTNWVKRAKETLHIAYGHTSHGSQIVDGMTGLVGFMTQQGYPQDLFAWNAGGATGALDLRDMPFGGWYDLGSPDFATWASLTRSYLRTNSSCNVVMWAWCGELTTAAEGDVTNYLGLMDGLQNDFANVRFIFMTGHMDGWGPEGNLNARNNQIRSHCLAHGDILYDFGDIECYDPSGKTNYLFYYVNDGCWYGPTGSQNWALEWQNSHLEAVDWFNCGSVHTQPLNANLKAYAAWWLWARLAGWEGPLPPSPSLMISHPVPGKMSFFYDLPQSFSRDDFLLECSSNLKSWAVISIEPPSSYSEAISNNWQRVVLNPTNPLPPISAFFHLRTTGE